jgi:menaquinone-dependent protoporphyrinogen oxidase
VFYATKDGHTRKIAEYLASELCTRGVDAEALNVNSIEATSMDWASVRAAVVGAPIYIGKHLKEAAAFVREHRAQLNERPTTFFSVCLAIRSSNAVEVKAAEDIATRFIEDTGWYADEVVNFAGCLAYTKYNFFKRFVLKRIAKKEGGSTDTSRDHEYTDWTKVSELAERIALTVKSKSPVKVVA